MISLNKNFGTLLDVANNDDNIDEWDKWLSESGHQQYEKNGDNVECEIYENWSLFN